MVDIDKLMKKKKWSGKELGQLELAVLFDYFSRCQENDSGFCVDRNVLSDMVETLTDEDDVYMYNGYISIHDWFSRTYYSAVSQQAQAYNSLNTIAYALTSAINAEDIYSCVSDRNEKLDAILERMSVSVFCDERMAQHIENARNELPQNCYFLFGYNKILDLIAEIYEIEEIKVTKFDTDELVREIDNVNSMIETLCGVIKKAVYDEKKIRERTEIMGRLFCRIPDTELPEDRIAKARKMMKDFKTFENDIFDPRYILCYR